MAVVVTLMPWPVLPEITLRAAAVLPPITTLSLVRTLMPMPALARAAVPEAFRPMMLPVMVVSPSRMSMPGPALPEITLPVMVVLPVSSL